MGVMVKRLLFGGFSVVFFALAGYQYHLAGFTSMTVFAGASALVLALACITAKG
jgi:hypothetical protein